MPVVTLPPAFQSILPAIESVDVTDNLDYAWPEPPCRYMGKRRDNDYKNVPETR